MRISNQNHWLLLVMSSVLLLNACSSSKKTANKKEEPASIAAPADWLSEYSAKMGINLAPNINQQLVNYVADWLGVPYKYGGNSKAGTDCSGFIGNVYPQVYGIPVARTTSALYTMAKPAAVNELKDGDLVFFRINTPSVGHAGIYLCNNYFIHASTSKGVMVSSLDEPYWKKYFVAAGRLVP